MSNFDTNKYSIFCSIQGSKNHFSVKIEEGNTVDELKDAIKEKKAPELDGFAASSLTLFKINACGDTLQEKTKALEEEIRRVDELRKNISDADLEASEIIHDLFPNWPPSIETISILVVLPQVNTGRGNQKGKQEEPGSRDLSVDRLIDNPSTIHRLLDAGYEVLREEDDPESGWAILNPLKPTLSRAKRSTGEIVMLKLVESDELAIHSFLDSVKSQGNHTIALLDQVALETETIIVMSDERVLRDVPLSVFKASGNDLAHQFLEGVRFMHENKVAHLDLKPDNILVTITTNPLRLLIIDFSVSLQVDTEESWVEGYRGTKGWAAPEVQDDQYQPIRADLWSAGQVLQYIAHYYHHADTNSPLPSPSPFKYKSLAKKLQHRNPLERPLLGNIDLYHDSPPILQLKRKRGVDEQEENEVERRWLPFGPQPVVALPFPIRC